LGDARGRRLTNPHEADVNSPIPERISWAIETMDVRPDDQILEIGAGRGVAVAVISELLTEGMITAIDRSEKAIEAARRRNGVGIASGTVALHPLALEDAGFPDRSFNKVFAINVNLFWVKDPAHELAVIERMLKPGGTLYLFYEPPSASQVAPLARTVAAALRERGFTVTRRTTMRAGRSLVCAIGRVRLVSLA
jgi:ubiquinone/menaquinone biosynthesis C-methylase UbiE